jgi:hypothetical protein
MLANSIELFIKYQISFFPVLGIKLRTLYILGKYLSTEPHLSLKRYFYSTFIHTISSIWDRESTCGKA